MSVEVDIYSCLKSLVGNRVYRDIAPQTVTELPRITFQTVGGASTNFLDSATIPSKRNARVQVNVWHSRRDDANALARQVEEALRAYTALQTTVLSGFVAVYEEETKLFGTMQDYSFWS
jgi:hypothetical protein